MPDRMAILIYRPEDYQGRSDVVLYAMLDFVQRTDRAVILADGQPFAVAEGTMREVATPPRPSRPKRLPENSNRSEGKAD